MSISVFAQNVEKKIDDSRLAAALRRVFGSYVFPVVIAAITVVCYYFALDMVLVWCLALSMIAVLAVCKDLSPLITPFLFINIIVSKQLSPAYGGNETTDYYLQAGTITQLCVAIGITVLFMLIRACYSAAKGDFKPTSAFYFVCVFAFSLILNGAFSAEYQVMGTLFGMLLALTFVALFILIRGNVNADETMLKRLAFSFAVFAAVLIAELIVAYCTYDVIIDGKADRSKLTFGWGGYNNMGMWLTCAIPSAFYLAVKCRRCGSLFTVYAVVITIAAFCTMSRQAMVGSLAVFILCCIWLFAVTKGRARIVNIAIVAFSAVAVGIAWLVWTADLEKFFSSFWGSLQTGSGRTDIWKAAWQVFLENPVFGAGFYTEVHPAAKLQDGITFLPPMNHNTIMELASACGAVGMVAYGAHRAQTVVSLVRDFRTPRIYIALIICAFLLVSLFDNYVFYILTTVTYVFLIAVFDKTDESYAKARLKRINKS